MRRRTKDDEERKRVIKRFAYFVLAILFCISCSGVSQAELFYFEGITNNNPGGGDVAIGEAQLSVEVTNGLDTVMFTFRNALGSESAISEIYFDDGSLSSFNSIIDDPPNVDFKRMAKPKDLPGGNLMDPPFVADQQFSMESGNPVPHKGVNPGEELGIVYNLVGGQTFEDIIDELTVYPFALRIGLHVTDFDSGYSESFATPEPATIVLLGLGSLVLIRRRKA